MLSSKRTCVCLNFINLCLLMKMSFVFILGVVGYYENKIVELVGCGNLVHISLICKAHVGNLIHRLNVMPEKSDKELEPVLPDNASSDRTEIADIFSWSPFDDPSYMSIHIHELSIMVCSSVWPI